MRELVAIEKRILIIGNNSALCFMLPLHMENEDTQVDYVNSIGEAINAFICADYCLAILGIKKGESDEIKTVHLMRMAKTTPILIISNALKPEIKIKLFQAGASAHIEEPASVEVCIAQANALVQLYGTREVQSKKDDISFGAKLIICPRLRQVFASGKELVLTRKEFELLYFLAKHPLQVFSCEQLYAHVWQDGYATYGDDTVKVHIGRLRKKLNTAEAAYIQNVWGIGYKFVPPDLNPNNIYVPH